MKITTGKGVRWVKLVMLGLVIPLFAACSDGVRPDLEIPNPALNLPVITAFTVASAAQPEVAADTVAIEAGEDVVLKWEVSGATTTSR